MKKYSISFSLLVFVQLCATASAAVVVTEFMYDPSLADSDWEWVEIYNTGPSAVDLNGWELDDVGGGGSSPVTITASSFEIDPYEYVVLTDRDLATFNAEWNTSLTSDNLITMSNIPGLNNTGTDAVRLLDAGSAEQFILTYSDPVVQGLSFGYRGYMVESLAEFGDVSNWFAASVLSASFEADSGDFGSPGSFNGSAVPEPSTMALFLLGGVLIRMRLSRKRA